MEKFDVFNREALHRITGKCDAYGIDYTVHQDMCGAGFNLVLIGTVQRISTQSARVLVVVDNGKAVDKGWIRAFIDRDRLGTVFPLRYAELFVVTRLFFVNIPLRL